MYICEVTSSSIEERLKIIRNEAIEAHRILGVKRAYFLDFPAAWWGEVPLIDMNASFLDG